MTEIDQRLFGRVRAALIECPSCGELWDLRAGSRGTGRTPGATRKHQAGIFDPLTARFRCPACGLKAVIGLVLYLVEDGDRDAQAPRDWRAGVREGIKIREAARARVSGESWKERRRWRGANQVRKGEQ